MPQKALVAFGVVLGFGLLLSVPGWCSDTSAWERSGGRPSATAPKTIDEHSSSSLPAPSMPTLDKALTRALTHSPKLAAFSREVEARGFETLQAGLRPNPDLSLEVENVAGGGEFSGTDSAETTIRISQRFELGGKRERRRELGRLEEELAAREYEIARAEVLAETRDRFVAVLAAQERLSLGEERLALARNVLQAVEERIAAGKTAAMEKVPFQTLVAEARLRRDQARHERDAARLALAHAWGSEAVDFESVQGSLENVREVPSWPEVMARLDQSPRAARLQSASGKGDRLQELARANRIPDLTLSLGVRNDRETGDNALVGEISMPLPIFDRNRGAMDAARVRKAKAADEARSVQLQLQAGLAGDWQRMQAAHSEVAALRENILPAARKSFEAVAYGYQAGKFGFLEVLDAERTLFEAKSRYVEALTAFHQAVSSLERLLGQGLLRGDDFSPSFENTRGQS